MLNIIFAGTPPFAAQHLQYLLDHSDFNICAVYTQPDRRKGRGKKTIPTAVKEVALAANLTVHQPNTLNSATEQQALHNYHADIMVVVAYGLILPKVILDMPRLGCINVHGSLLPRWRGAAPIERAIEAGDNCTGITIMQMDVGLDDGPMLLKETTTIEQNDTGDTLREKLANQGCRLLLNSLQKFATQSNQPNDIQNHADANYAHKLKKQEAHINWQSNAQVIERKIRAFNSQNTCYTELITHDNPQAIRIKLWDVELTTTASMHDAGTIINATKEGLDISCRDFILRVKTMQLPGGKVLAVKDILNSRAHWFTKGTTFINPEQHT